MKRPIALKEGFRTPFVKVDKEFTELNAVELSSCLVEGMLERGSFPLKYLQHVIWGMVMPDPNIYSVAREVVLQTSLDNGVEAYSLTRACATSLQAAVNAAVYYHAFPEEASVTLVGGVESFSNARPFLRKEAARYFKNLSKKRTFFKKIFSSLQIPLSKILPVPPAAREYSTGLTMGQHCELMVKEFGISRERQDSFSLASHKNAAAAEEMLRAQIIPVLGVQEDTLIRKDASLKALSHLKPAFDPLLGTVTAGNSSAYTDGAAGLFVISPALEEKIVPDAYLVDFEFVGVDPLKGLLMGPGKATLFLLQRQRLRFEDFDYIDIHEAFAGEVLCNVDAINDANYRKKAYGIDYDPGKLDEKILNPWGSSIAYGHPFGATGARMLSQAIAFLKYYDKKLALLAICTAGALAGACIIRRGQ